jgi:hypothetical protein
MPRVFLRQFFLAWAALLERRIIRLPTLPTMPDASQLSRCGTARNNPIDSGLMPKKELLQNQILFVCGEG